MNIQEAVKAIQQNGEAMRRTRWSTTKVMIGECETVNWDIYTGLVDERHKKWNPMPSDIVADDWVLCDREDDPAADRRMEEIKEDMRRKDIEQAERLEECRRLNIGALIITGFVLLVNALHAWLGF